MARTTVRSKLLLLLLGCALGLVAVEVALRFGGFSIPSHRVPDPLLGSRGRPGAEYWHVKEGRAHVRYNAHGFRDSERSLQKPANTLRVAVVGDSYIEALQVSMKERITELTEEHLRGKLAADPALASRDVEVLNFGVSGCGTGYQLLVLRHEVVKYSPDVVVLAFLTGNDVRNNSKELEGRPGRPYFVLENGEWVLDAGFHRRVRDNDLWWKRAIRTARDHSKVLQLAEKARRTWRVLADRQGRLEDLPDEDQDAVLDLRQAGVTVKAFKAPEDDAWKRAWRTTEALLNRVQMLLSYSIGTCCAIMCMHEPHCGLAGHVGLSLPIARPQRYACTHSL